MLKEEEQRKHLDDTQRVRVAHYNRMLALEQTYYDKHLLNDSEMDFAYLHDK